MNETVRVERNRPVATVTMARPEVHNAFNEHLIAALHEAFTALGADPGIRGIVLAGEGKSFSVGADLDWMRRMGEASTDANREDARKLSAMLRAVAECPKPVIARVHGAALGGGSGLCAAADIAIAADSAVFGFSEVRLGLAPATIGPHVVEKIGAAHALPRFLTGERFDAHVAQSIGLVYRVVADAELDTAVAEAVEALLQGGPQGQIAAKRLVRKIASTPRDEIDAYTSTVIATLRTSDEGREGVRAFLEKRRPSWTPDVETSRRNLSTPPGEDIA